VAKSESDYIDLCKKLIEEKFSFGNGEGYSQKDLELLAVQLEEKTNVIISLSTLKRLWKGSFKQSPQRATLDALVQLLDCKDWGEFKRAHQIKPERQPSTKNRRLLGSLTMMLVTIVVSFVFMLQPSESIPFKRSLSPDITGPILFEVKKTVPIGVPSTVIFTYDVSNVKADTFYLQQSWNEDHRVLIDPHGSVISSIYYESGYHHAKLIANDSVIASQPVHIISDGWEPHIYHSESDPELIDFKNINFLSNGILHINRSTLEKHGIDFSRNFNTRITNSQNFNVHSDNFSFITRMKADSVFNRVCGWMDLIIVTDVQTFSVSWTAKGCEKHAAYKLGEVLRKGDTNDLSALGGNLYDWHELELHVKNRYAEIHLDGQLVFDETYLQNFGNIRSLIYLFDGTGSIDYTILKDGAGRVLYADTFDDR
jgi:hypothetical protein